MHKIKNIADFVPEENHTSILIKTAYILIIKRETDAILMNYLSIIHPCNSRSGQQGHDIQSGILSKTEHDIHILHRLSCRSLDQIVNYG